MLTGTGGSSCRDGGAAEGPAQGARPSPPTPHHDSPRPAAGAPGVGVSSPPRLGSQRPSWQPAPPLGPGRQAGKVGLRQDGSGWAHRGRRRETQVSLLEAFLRGRAEVPGCGVGRTPVQTLALLLTSCRGTLGKLLRISLSLRFLPLGQVWKLPSRAPGEREPRPALQSTDTRLGLHVARAIVVNDGGTMMPPNDLA